MQLSSSCLLCDGLGLFTCGSWIAGVFSKSSPISLPCDWQSRVNFRKLLTFPVFPENTNKGVWDHPWDGNLDFKRHKKKTYKTTERKKTLSQFVFLLLVAKAAQPLSIQRKTKPLQRMQGLFWSSLPAAGGPAASAMVGAALLDGSAALAVLCETSWIPPAKGAQISQLKLFVVLSSIWPESSQGNVESTCSVEYLDQWYPSGTCTSW